MPNASSEKQIDKDEDVSLPTKREATEMEIQSNAVPDQEVQELLL